jgi:hypothetical protein
MQMNATICQFILLSYIWFMKKSPTRLGEDPFYLSSLADCGLSVLELELEKPGEGLIASGLSRRIHSDDSPPRL